MNIPQLLVGCDPEFFLMDKKTGKPVSPHKSIPGTKEKPFHTSGFTSVQVDGLAVEVGILPTSSRDIFVGRVQEAVNCVRMFTDHDFNFSPSVYFDKDYYENEVPAAAKVLGCTPDRDATRGGLFNRPPDVVVKDGKYMRSAGGHIHLGWGSDFNPDEPNHIKDCIKLVKNLDTLFERYSYTWDKDTDRKSMYGAPGAFRPKSYGVEYRSPSNAWLQHPDLIGFVYDLSKFAFQATFLNADLAERFKGIKKTDIPTIYTNQYDIGRIDRYTIPDLVLKGL